MTEQFDGQGPNGNNHLELPTDVHPARKKRISPEVKGVGIVVLACGLGAGFLRYCSNDNGSESARELLTPSASASPSPTKQLDTFQFTSKDGRKWDCTIKEKPYSVRKGDNLGRIVQNHQTPQTKGEGVLQDEIAATAAINGISLTTILQPRDKIRQLNECEDIGAESPQPKPTQT